MLKKTVAATADLGMPQWKTGRAGLRPGIWKVLGIAYVRKKNFGDADFEEIAPTSKSRSACNRPARYAEPCEKHWELLILEPWL